MQPPLSDPVWGGKADGAIYACIRPNVAGVPDPGMTSIWWLPGDPAKEPAVNPEAVARRLLARIGLEAINIGSMPKGHIIEKMGFVNWNTWLWADEPSDRQWGPIEASETVGGVTVRLRAEVTEITYDLGNGDTITCGKGTRWSMTGSQGGSNVPSPTCSYMYRKQGRYTLRATSTWRVEWSSGGRSGTIPFELVRQRPMIIGELQSVNVNR